MSIYWNIKKNSDIDETTMIEHTLKYGDLDDIIELFKRINNDKIKEIWLKTMAPDRRFLKLNLMIARIFFDMNVEKDYFESLDNARFKVRVSVK
ncbi:hypothetical protein OWM07_09130 [Deferribacter thermophilus]|uniref:hypothetical protein n=1 Tax=Deferribacter thermophilus TaxID=53573 RepID=UPI003C1B8F37